MKITYHNDYRLQKLQMFYYYKRLHVGGHGWWGTI